ncbi:pentapeptide repeat-containing protein [Umezawaea beigongshangensis]|uniref:pentapeptide repeat-containing protein n=1 Tax=Umezawaea beigongshangensis TaxID=2780383 RepID=UPI0027DC8060|nr:pentapeptide repeat-containing protein [Umezawaea beigongshangensis]
MALPERRRQALLLSATLLIAVAATAAIGAWVLAADERAGVAEAIKTGGLAGAAVIALYGLWLNDRRRRVEEDRQHVEERRLVVEGDRISHERFARAIELLGNDADQVRVGAMHALVGLARSTPSYTRTVVDVLCAYLRRPFHHHAYDEAHDPDRSDLAAPALGALPPEKAAADRERQVRLTAQRVLLDLLPPAGADGGESYDLDLTGASLEYLDLAGRRVGGLLARRATFYGITRLAGTRFDGRVMFTGAAFLGRVSLAGARFGGGVSLLEVRFAQQADLSGATFTSFADLRWEEPAAVLQENTTAEPGTGVKRNPADD